MELEDETAWLRRLVKINNLRRERFMPTNDQQVWVPDYPEAQQKIDYYSAIVDELQGYIIAANTAYNNITQHRKRSNVESGNNGEGPYFDVFIKQKEKWFDDLEQMRSDLNSYISQIIAKKGEATNLKSEWVVKSKEGHYE